MGSHELPGSSQGLSGNLVPELIFTQRRQEGLRLDETARLEAQEWVNLLPEFGLTPGTSEVAIRGQQKLQQWFREHPPIDSRP